MSTPLILNELQVRQLRDGHDFTADGKWQDLLCDSHEALRAQVSALTATTAQAEAAEKHNEILRKQNAELLADLPLSTFIAELNAKLDRVVAGWRELEAENAALRATIAAGQHETTREAYIAGYMQGARDWLNEEFPVRSNMLEMAARKWESWPLREAQLREADAARAARSGGPAAPTTPENGNG